MKVKINIPTSLNEITLGQYQDYLKIAKDNDDTNFLLQKTIQIFCNIPILDVSQFQYKDVIEIVTKINTVFEEKTNLIPRFKLQNTRFGFIPNLEEMTFEEYSNLDQYLSDWNDMHRAMAILYRPIKNEYKQTYSIKSFTGTKEYAETMKSMPLNIVFGANVFFWNLSNDLLTASQNYLQKTMESLIQHQTSGENGAGITPYTYSLVEVLSTLKKLKELT